MPGHELVLKYIKIEDKNDAHGIPIKKGSSKSHFLKELVIAAPVDMAHPANINTLPARNKLKSCFVLFCFFRNCIYLTEGYFQFQMINRTYTFLAWTHFIQQ